MVNAVSLHTDVVDLKALLKDSEIIVTPIETSKNTSICVTIGNAEEASPKEFSIIKTFATDKGYDFNEDRDNKHNRMLHYYVLTVPAPF